MQAKIIEDFDKFVASKRLEEVNAKGENSEDEYDPEEPKEEHDYAVFKELRTVNGKQNSIIFYCLLCKIFDQEL